MGWGVVKGKMFLELNIFKNLWTVEVARGQTADCIPTLNSHIILNDKGRPTNSLE